MSWLLAPYRRLRLATGNILRRRLRMRPRVVVPDLEVARFEHVYEVAVYFPDGPGNLYQLGQWFQPLADLNKNHRVLIVTRNHRSFRIIRAETDMPVAFVRRVSDLDEFIADGELKLALYVNHARSNFQMLRYGEMIHAHIGHGESEKSSMASHQIRAYDYAFVAGRRAVDRYRGALLEFDNEMRSRMVLIGRPQLDIQSDAEVGRFDLPMILYAPTWEGDRPTMRYSSLGTLGVEIVDALIRSGKYRLVYRPHPRTGDYDPDVKAADEAIREIIETASARAPEVGHLVDVVSPLNEQIMSSAVGIADVSAVALDYLASSKPVIVTNLEHVEPLTGESEELLDVLYRFGPTEDSTLVDLIDSAVSRDPKRRQRLALAEEYFGDLTPGASMKRFLDACERLIYRRDSLVRTGGRSE